MCVWGMGRPTASTPTAWLGTGMLYKVVIDRVAGVVEATFLPAT